MEEAFKQYLLWCETLDAELKRDWAKEPVPDVESSLPREPGEVARWRFLFAPPSGDPRPAGCPTEAVLLIRPEAVQYTKPGDGSGTLPRFLLGSRWREYLRMVSQGAVPVSLLEGVSVEPGSPRG